MRVLITGASGFIGKQLLPLLRKHEVLILSRTIVDTVRDNFICLRSDLAQLDTIKEQLSSFKPEVCIHLAWEGLPDYSLKTCHHNFNISVNLIEMMGDLGCRKIFISGSCWEYGHISGKVAEEDTPGKTGLFASFKTALRLVAESMADDYGFELVWGRIFFAYGPGQRQNSLIPACIKNFKNNQLPDIRTPYAINDFIHIKDVAHCILALVENINTKGIYNIASGIPVTILDVVHLIADLMGKTSLLRFNMDKEQECGFWADTSCLQEAVPNFISTSLSDGINRLLDEYDKDGEK
ncbi:MAG: NAD(P)-dependent oxidoreductase [Proteobacteria bacterium]|nr:NAD(P)-dependent oxidoreductase [Pseudomonadota bacterium]MBU1389464.1 NAD(P)-dependent oxidoreductase [Pseudomonadota bacterium]MBU1541284.1 NAD(P)-dependent oxidoreductase [Pseudomonadota bacterium]MBU2430157.1 NAD(P)-dependent oxidoreductase [Pseudomonadota bacterium]